MPDLALLVNLLQLAIKDRTQLALENIALRHQLAVYKRSVKRPNINDGDRIFWLTVMRMLKEWRQALVFVQPETVPAARASAGDVGGGEARDDGPGRGLRSGGTGRAADRRTPLLRHEPRERHVGRASHRG